MKFLCTEATVETDSDDDDFKPGSWLSGEGYEEGAQDLFHNEMSNSKSDRTDYHNFKPFLKLDIGVIPKTMITLALLSPFSLLVASISSLICLLIPSEVVYWSTRLYSFQV